MKLFAPEEYWRLSEEIRAAMVNGCGPSGWKSKYIPGHILWINVTEACNIHDFMYAVGKTEGDREEADRVFFNNMMRIIESVDQVWILRRWRRRIALEYYQQVRDFGAIYFWKGKNPLATMHTPQGLPA